MNQQEPHLTDNCTIANQIIVNDPSLFEINDKEFYFDELDNNIDESACKSSFSLLKKLQHYALAHDGLCISTKCCNINSTIKMKCQKGHFWSREATCFLRQKLWCPDCRYQNNVEKDNCDDKRAREMSIGLLERLQRWASLHNGICHATSCPYLTYKVKMECENGHFWTRQANSFLKRELWCPDCRGEDNTKIQLKEENVDDKEALSLLDELKQWASDHNGICHSKKCSSIYSIIKMECDKGHGWSREATSFLRRKLWCPNCKENDLIKKQIEDGSIEFLERLKSWASDHKGICHSEKCVTINSNIDMECEIGHRWTRQANSFLNLGMWCPDCATETRHKAYYDRVRAEIERRNGRCISDSCNTADDRVTIECEFKHKWAVSGASVLNNDAWCPACSGVERYTIEKVREIAEERNGKCLSEIYVNAHTKLWWQCYSGHKWEAKLNSVLSKNSWCPKCSITVGEEITRKILELSFREKFDKIRHPLIQGLELDGYCEKLKIAFEHNGDIHYNYIPYIHKTIEGFKEIQRRDILKAQLCHDNDIFLIVIPYTVKYDNIQQFIIDECNKKGIIIPNLVKIDYRKLDDIYNTNIRKYENIKKIVESKGGILISQVYVIGSEPLNVKCKCGHEWITHANRIIAGHWCPECAKKTGNPLITLESLNILAHTYGGKCLSEEYSTLTPWKKLSWQCDVGHRWYATPKMIRSGTWCLECYSTILES